MPRTVRQIFAIFLVVTSLTGDSTCRASAPTVSAESYILMDADSGRVLLGQNETQEKSIASTTKIMTALVAIESSRLSDTVTVKKAHLKEGSSMYLAEGEVVTMEALLYGLLLPSGNDAAECIADHCGGRETFLSRMNDKAEQLGMTHSSFKNPSGLDEDGHYSCALDMARLAAYAMQNPTFARICATVTATVGERVMGNHNKLLGTVEGCIGLKNGFTDDAGRTLVTCCERDGLRLIAVTLHDSCDKVDHDALYDYGFSVYHRHSAVRCGAACGTAAVRGGTETYVTALAARGFACSLTDGERVVTRLDLPQSIQAPVEKGQTLGELVILLHGEELARVPLVSDRTVRAAAAEKSGAAEWLYRLLTK